MEDVYGMEWNGMHCSVIAMECNGVQWSAMECNVSNDKGKIEVERSRRSWWVGTVPYGGSRYR
jgi:hypothetical protein